MSDQETDDFVVSDPELITRVRTGDREAYGELYKRHAGAATTLSRQFARSATESDDLVSESFARVLDNLLAGKGPDTAFRAYLFTTIRNTAYDRTRKDKRLQFTDDMTTHDSAVVGDDPVLAKMESGLVATAFAQLPERWQAVLWHTQVEGETPAQVGALLGMAPGAVSSLAFRAREGLREAYLQAHLAETAAEQCRTTVERLGAWTRGGLSKREKAQVDAHLETCDRCRALAAELEEVNHGLRGLLAPLLLGGAAAGYLATLGPVAPLAAPGTLIAGAGATGAGTTGGAGSGAGGAGASGAGGSGAAGAGGSGASGTGGVGGSAGAAGGTAGAAGGAAGGSAAATAAGVAAAAAAVAAGAIGVAALAPSGSSGGATAAAAGTSVAGISAAGTGAAAGGTAGTGAAGTGAAATGAAGAGAAGGGTGAAGASATGAAGAGATAGTGGAFAGMGVGGLVAAGAVLVAAAVAAVVFIVSGNSPDTTTTAGQDIAASGQAQSDAAGPATGDPGAAGITLAEPGPGGTSGTVAPVSIIPGGDPATTAAGDGAVVPVADTTPQSTAPTGGEPDDPATADPSASSTANPPSSSNPLATDSTATDPTSPPTEPTTSTSAPTPPPPSADLVVTDLTAQPLNAGGSADISLTVTNKGNGASAIEPVSVDLPTGVQITNVTVGDAQPALRRVNAGLLRAGPCVTQTATNCTLNLPALDALKKFPITLTLSAATTALDGPMTVTVLSRSVTFFLNVNSPAALNLGKLTESRPLIAGGSGQLSVDVTNAGEQQSRNEPVEVLLPDGVSVAEMTLGGQVFCEAPDPANAQAAAFSCTLPQVDPTREPRTLLIDLVVPATTPTSAKDSATVIVGGNIATAAGTPVTVLPGIISLGTAPAGPFTAGRPATLAVVPDVLDTVTEAGPITITSADATVTFDPSSGCSPITGANAVSCTSSAFDLDIAIPADHDAGPLSITATDAGGRTLEFPNVNLQITAAQPSTIVVTRLTTGRFLVAGGTGQLTVQVTNSGALPSAEELIDRDLPPGITVTDITEAGRSLCSTPVPGLNPVAVVARPTCTLPSVAAGENTTLLIELAVAPSARTEPGQATVTIGTGRANSSTTTLAVRAGITGLDTTPAGPFIAGQPLRLTVTPQASDGVTAGDVTLVSGDPAVTFGPTPDCEPIPGINAVTCNRDPLVTPTLPFTVPVNIPVTHPAGELVITASDAGDRKLRFTDAPLMVVAAAPANLEVSGLRMTERLVAGGSGELTVQVKNTGASPSPEQFIRVGLPPDITVTGIAAAESGLCTTSETGFACLLPPLDPAAARTLVIDLTVPAATVYKPGNATVTIGGGPNRSDSEPLIVHSGINALRTDATNPLYTNSARILQIKAVSTVDDPGPITFFSTSSGVTFGESTGCEAPVGNSTIVCDNTSFSLSLAISAEQKPGDFPVMVMDEGLRKLKLKDANGQVLRIERAKPSLRLDTLAFGTPLVAGGTGTLTVRVSNIGGQPAPEQPITVELPNGVALEDMTVGGSSICAPLREGTPTCTLPEIDPTKPITVVIALEAQPAATELPGYAKVIIPGDTKSIRLAVTSGISSLVAAERGPLDAGSTVRLTVTPQLLKGVTAAGPLKLTATAGVTFGESTDCRPSPGGSTITCEGSEFTFTMIIPAGQPAGRLPVQAVDAGLRTVDLLDADLKPFDVVAPERLSVSNLRVFQAPGSGGVILLEVTNDTGQASSPMPIDISLPHGFTTVLVISRLKPGDRFDYCLKLPCNLASIEPTATVALTIAFAADWSATNGQAKVTIDGVPKTGDLAGRSSDLDLFTTSDPTAPTESSQPKMFQPKTFQPDASAPDSAQPDSAQPQAPSTGPAPTGTEPSTPAASEAGATPAAPETPTAPAARATPAAPETSPAADPGPVPSTPSTAQDAPVPTESAAPRPTESTPTATEATSSDQTSSRPADPPPPAAVVLSEPTGDEALTVGGTGSLMFTATNEGGERSAQTGFDLSLPAGVSVRSISVDGTSICDGPSCRMPEIAPGQSATVLVAIRAAPGAATGGAEATINGSGVGWLLQIRPVPAGVTPTTVLPPTEIGDAPGVRDLVPPGN